MDSVRDSVNNGKHEIPGQLQNEVLHALKSCRVTIAKSAASKIREHILTELRKHGWSEDLLLDPDSRIAITACKDNVGLCLQTGNIARIYADYIKLQTLFLQGRIEAAILIVPSDRAAKVLGNNLTSASRVLRELEIFSDALTLPILIVNFD